MIGLAGALYAIMTVYFHQRNKARAAGKEDGAVAGLSEAEILELGDENPTFVYTE